VASGGIAGHLYELACRICRPVESEHTVFVANHVRLPKGHVDAYGDDNLVSRSQAKRLLARVDRFRTVVLDFAGVDAIGQAFADEVFRVHANQHPEATLVEVNATPPVMRMVNRAPGAG
jgi:hypothetical protein